MAACSLCGLDCLLAGGVGHGVTFRSQLGLEFFHCHFQFYDQVGDLSLLGATVVTFAEVVLVAFQFLAEGTEGVEDSGLGHFVSFSIHHGMNYSGEPRFWQL